MLKIRYILLVLAVMISFSATNRQITLRHYSEMALADDIALASIVARTDTSFLLHPIDIIKGCDEQGPIEVLLCSRKNDMPCSHTFSRDHYAPGDTILIHFNYGWGAGRAGEEIVRYSKGQLIYHINPFFLDAYSIKYGATTGYSFSLDGKYRFDYQTMKKAYLLFNELHDKIRKKVYHEKEVKRLRSRNSLSRKTPAPVLKSRFLKRFQAISPAHEFLLDQMVDDVVF